MAHSAQPKLIPPETDHDHRSVRRRRAGRRHSHGSSLIFSTDISARSLWWRMSEVPVAPLARFAPLTRHPTDTRSCPVTSAPTCSHPPSTRDLGYDPQKDFHADWTECRISRAAGRPQGLPRQQPQGIHCLCQMPMPASSMSGTPDCRLGLLYRLPAAQLRDRHQADIGAVHRHRPGAERDPRGFGRL